MEMKNRAQSTRIVSMLWHSSISQFSFWAGWHETVPANRVYPPGGVLLLSRIAHTPDDKKKTLPGNRYIRRGTKERNLPPSPISPGRVKSDFSIQLV